MRLTKDQKREILPLLQQAVQAKIDQWDAERQIEGILGVEMDRMNTSADDLAISYDRGNQVKLEDVQTYIDGCVVEGNDD